MNAALQGGLFKNNRGGFIAGVLAPIVFNPEVVIATELAWWAPGGGGRELREVFESWARDSGAHFVQFSALADDNISKVHENMTKSGLHLTEMAYLKELS